VLNLYGYTGGFSVAAGLGGAVHVDTVDIAAPAIETAVATWAANGLDPSAHDGHVADAPAYLASAREIRFDLVVADPPSFAPRESARAAALESYEKLHAACLGVLGASGLYLAASCSSHVGRADFDATLREGTARAKRTAQILGTWGAPADHPRLASFPEGDYLKVTLARVID
jgi:23S rRNA (cytosine1962-C5)-methyltransferase